MEPQRDEEIVETDRARAGSTPHVVRWILVVSLVLAIVLLSITWITGALSMGQRGSEATAVDRRADHSGTEHSDTDGIVSDRADQIGNAPAQMSSPVASEAEPTVVENH